jgi:xanthosine utilization system XapX-like protein
VLAVGIHGAVVSVRVPFSPGHLFLGFLGIWLEPFTEWLDEG